LQKAWSFLVKVVTMIKSGANFIGWKKKGNATQCRSSSRRRIVAPVFLSSPGARYLSWQLVLWKFVAARAVADLNYALWYVFAVILWLSPWC